MFIGHPSGPKAPTESGRLFGRMLRILGLALALPGLAARTPASDSLDFLRPALRFQGVGEGLPNLTVYSLHLDERGRLWASTQDGVAFFNGRNWSVLNLPSLGSTNFVRSMAQTPDGSWWFGTESGGLWRLNGGQWTHLGRAEGLPNERINGLRAEGGAQDWSLLVGTGGGGAVRFQNGRWTPLGVEAGLPSGWVWRFGSLRRPEGRACTWAATQGGIALLEGGRWTVPGEFKALAGLEVNDLAQVKDAEGRLETWVSAWGKGLYRWDGTRWMLFGPEQGFPSRFPVALKVTAEGALWAGTFDAGLARLSQGRWTQLDAARGLPSNGAYALLAPSGGRPSLWVGMRGGGVAGLDPEGWHSLDRSLGLPSDEVQAFAEAPGPGGEPIPWVGTSRGLAYWDGRAWKVEGRAQGLPSEKIQSLHAAGNVLWAGTMEGLARREGGRWHRVELDLPLKDRRILCVREGRGDSGQPLLWLGTESGLIRVEGGRSRLLTTADGLPSNLVYALLETRDEAGRGSLWVGTRGGGVARLHQGRWTSYGAAQGIPNSVVYGLGLHRTPDGRNWLWAGTFGGGAARLDLAHPEGPWELFNTETLPGLPSNVVVQVAVDLRNRLYLMTQRGVARLEFPEGSRPGRVEAFALGDGLAPVSCSYGASMVDRQGRVWVATYKGAGVLDPALEGDPGPLRPLNLDRVRVKDRGLGWEELLHLGHRDHPLFFEYGLATFHRTEDVRYRTQLVGVEAEPTPWTGETKREIAVLPPGEYRFRVWARDHLGRETAPMEVPFRIHPPWWATRIAYAGYLLAGLFLLGTAYRLRTRMLLQRNRILDGRIREATRELERRREELERLDREKTQFMGIAAHDLKNPLNALLLMADDLMESEPGPAAVRRHAQRLRRSVEQMTTLVSNLLDVNIIESGRLELQFEVQDLRVVLADVHGRNLEAARAKGLDFELVAPWESWLVRVDSERLREVVENLVSNAIKFSPPGPPARKVWLRMGPGAPGRVLVEVEDEGPGFSPEDLPRVFGRFTKLSARPTGGEGSTGLGLSIVKSLVERMGGTVSLESPPGKGACFRLGFPVVRG